MQECKMELIMQGHGIWLEKSKAEGDEVELALVYGHICARTE